MKNALGGKSVFVAASFPSGESGREFDQADPSAIADAVTSLVKAVLAAGGRVVFGGHPTITPLVLLVAGEHGHERAVDVYQSHWFGDVITAETYRLEELGYGTIHWTPRGSSQAESLTVMRVTMLQETQPIGGLFAGGMQGLIEEWELFGAILPGRPRLALAAPGGAAAFLHRQSDVPAAMRGTLRSSRYPALAHRVVTTLARQRPTGGP